MGAISILNVFFVPLIAISTMRRRATVARNSGVDFLISYGVISVCVNILTYFVVKIVETTTGIGPLLESHMYTLFSTIVAFIFPYVYEIYKKYIDVRLEIKEKGENK